MEYINDHYNMNIEILLVERLKKMNLVLSLCESCTGGRISAKITSVPGASRVFDRGIITYSNKAKIDELGVKAETLNKFGAVSEETALEMAKGLIKKTGSNIVLSITGIAGPDGGTYEKPVGLVYMCIMSKDQQKIIKNIFVGNRANIQERATVIALLEINKFLNKE